MEMIDWDEYEDDYFAKIGSSHKKFLFDKVLNDCADVSLSKLA